MTAVPGLHHVTAICGGPQDNVDFYTGVLDQRLVKKTVNFDEPGTYHLYYGDEIGSPGTILTFFPFVDAGEGRAGNGMASAVAYATTKNDFDAWMERLALAAVDFDGPEERFGTRVIALSDPDRLRVEIAEDEGMPGGGLHSVTLQLADPEPTARLLTELFGYEEAGEEKNAEHARLRLRTEGGEHGTLIDLVRDDGAGIGRQGAGTIHHVAFRARDDDEQRDLSERLIAAGFEPTSVIDRQYFNAIYFREPGGVLFEIATDAPGFTVDEPAESLGEALKLPERYERLRPRLEQMLPPIALRK